MHGTKNGQLVHILSQRKTGGEIIQPLNTIKRIAPEIVEIIDDRYLLLRYIFHNQPIGRRMLSKELNMKERKIRDEVEILKELELIKVDFKGMYISGRGIEVLKDLEAIYGNLKDIPSLEKRLKDLLGIKKVKIVPGDSNESRIILKDMGKSTFEMIKQLIKEGDIIGITGGSTMAKVVKEAQYDDKERNILVIPARGALGPDVEYQSNAISAKLANKLGGNYKLLHVPDTLDLETLESILKNEDIREAKEMIENINLLVFGIGRADAMGKRRNLKDDIMIKLEEGKAVAEAFGHYFNIKGEEVWQHRTIGLSLDRFRNLEDLIGVAGGEEKAHAIMAVSALNSNLTLITDETAAKSILETQNTNIL